MKTRFAPILCFLLALGPFAFAQTAVAQTLLRDINQQVFDLGIDYLTPLGDSFFFPFSDELWVTDGTPAGTELVTVVDAPEEGTVRIRAIGDYDKQFGRVNDKLVFRVGSNFRYEDLWVSDGTVSGTFNLTEFGAAEIYEGVTLGNNLFFAAERSNINELWMTDGTRAGTRQITVGLSHLYNEFSKTLTVARDSIFFMKWSATPPRRTMWKMDSTGESLEALDSYISENGSMIGYAGDLFYMWGQDETGGSEPWVSDGTPEGTRLLKDISPFSRGSDPHFIAELGNKALLLANDGVHDLELWISDGTEEGTLMLNDNNPTGSFIPWEVLVWGDKMFFTANEPDHGGELWLTDGTPDGTFLVKDINPGAGSSGPAAFGVVDGILYFCADDGTLGSELWRSDGTEAGTWMVKDLYPGSGDGNPGYFIPWKSGFLFSAFDGENGGALWFSDGTRDGTRMIIDVFDNPKPNSGVSSPVLFDGRLFFSAFDRIKGRELWVTDGTSNGTELFQDIRPGSASSSVSLMAVVNQKLFFNARGNGRSGELWTLAPGATAAVRISDPDDGPSKVTSSMEAPGDILVFIGSNSTAGSELWKTDGTIAGTQRITDVKQGPINSYPGLLGIIGNLIVFSAIVDDKKDLYSNAGALGTTEVLLEYIAADFWHSGVVNGKILFTGHNNWLFQTDGTPDGTKRLNTPNPLGDPSGMKFYHNVNDLVYFGATKSDENLGDELWRSDGTSPGTVQIKDIYPGSQGAHPHNFFGVEDRVYFAADDGSHGEELWISDGTETGTTLVADIVPGLGSSDPRPLATYKNYLIFSADDEIHGEEMWITDGTPGGTRLLLDFYDGPDGSNPGPVVFLDGDMIVYVDHPDYGRELWKIDASVLPVAVEEGLNVAHDFRLFENYPNPFNPTTTISYSLALPGNVELKVYNVIGELVKTLENRVLPAGEHSTSFNASGLSSGVYFYTLTAGHLTETRKMILLK